MYSSQRTVFLLHMPRLHLDSWAKGQREMAPVMFVSHFPTESKTVRQKHLTLTHVNFFAIGTFTSEIRKAG